MGASAGEDWDSFIDRMCRLETENTELLQKVQLLEQAGTRLSNRILDVLDNIVDESALSDALSKWVEVGGSKAVIAMANRGWGHPPMTREQSLEQEVKRLKQEVARLRTELDKAGYKRRYNPIYGWPDYLREKGQE